jgi:murein DD-endopeptidase MepM/ murein hydrolase activator NlpD
MPNSGAVMTHFLQRTALIALAAGALGACSTTDTNGALHPNYPVRSPEVPPPPAATPAPVAPAPSEAPIAVAPAAPVEQRPLDATPPPRPTPPASMPAPPPPAPPRAYTPPPAPVYRTVTTRSVTGKVVEVEGRAVTHKVKKGDTLEEIADKLGTTVRQLREDNGLSKRAKIHPGEVLKGPRSVGHAYVTGQGDTLYSIARRFGVTAEAIRDENDLGRGAGLGLGQKLRLPDGYRDHGPLTSTSRVLVAGAAPPAPTAEDAPAEVEEAPQAPRAAPSRPQAAYPAPAQPSYRTVTVRSVTGKVVEVEGPATTYKVKKGDSLEKVARKLDTTVDQLRDDNDIGRREAIQPGQTLKGPRKAAQAYVAGAGDTLYGIAKRFGVTADALREENDLGRNASLRPGQKLRLPEGFSDHGPLTMTTRTPVAPPVSQPSAPQTAPTPRPYYPPPLPPAAPAGSSTTQPAPGPRPYAPPPATSVPRPYVPPPRVYAPARPYTPPALPPAAGPAPGSAQLSELGRGRFVWPLQGPIISDFGPKAPGQSNDGINIGAQVGASIRAAAAGDVVYAGDQVPGFGNLVLIKHADGWVTAYGHLSRVMVKMQQKVAQGQEIGLAGATGGVSEPQLHFEVRYAPSQLERAKPIDPKLVLPK